RNVNGLVGGGEVPLRTPRRPPPRQGAPADTAGGDTAAADPAVNRRTAPPPQPAPTPPPAQGTTPRAAVLPSGPRRGG
ncbi:MAG TPA: hypothetical protein VGX50_03450, partial [Longimicrobium sp.]|nr:hypothetical protein [Longimicrobium sp.]